MALCGCAGARTKAQLGPENGGTHVENERRACGPLSRRLFQIAKPMGLKRVPRSMRFGQFAAASLDHLGSRIWFLRRVSNRWRSWAISCLVRRAEKGLGDGDGLEILMTTGDIALPPAPSLWEGEFETRQSTNDNRPERVNFPGDCLLILFLAVQATMAVAPSIDSIT